MPNRRVAVSLVLAAVAGLVGCESGPYSVGKSRTPEQRRAAFAISYEDYAKLGYRQDWVGYPAVTGSLPIKFFQVYEDLVAVVEQGSTLTVLEPNTGGRRCSVELSNPLTKFVGLTREGTRLIACSDADVFMIDTQTCNLAGRQKIEKIAATEPVKFGNLLIFGTNSGELLAHLMASTGIKAWGFGTGAAIEQNPVQIGATVGAVNQAGEVLFVDAASGSLVGRNRVFGGVDTAPVADENAMYFASLDQSVYAFAPTGQPLWRYRTAAPLRVQPTLHGGRLYVGILGEGLVAFDAARGQPVWKAKDLAGFTVVGMNKVGQLLAFDAKEQSAAVLDAQRGDVIERVKVPGATMMRLDSFEGGNLFVVSKSGVLAKFLPR